MLVIREFYCRAIEKDNGKILGAGIICLASLILLLAVAARAIEKSGSYENDNCLTICLPSDVDSMDPVNHRSRITQIVLKNIFDSLTARDTCNRVVPQLAEEWRTLSNTEWEFRLRKGVRFHNGDELRASDVVFTLDRIVNESYPGFPPSPRKGLFSPVSEVTAVDDYTIRIKTKNPWPGLPLMLSLQEIIPEKYMKRVGPEKFNEMPVGTGPFRFVHREENKEIVLERFEEYYGGSPERPPVQAAPLKNLVFKIVPSYLDQITLLKKKKCNLLFNIPPEFIPVLEMAGDINILNLPATRCIFADINCARPFFKDPRAREALNYAVDVETIVSQKLKGQARALSTIFLPKAEGFDPDLKPYHYNPEIARRLLKASNFPFEHVIDICTNQNDLIFADSISVYLTKLGLKTRVRIIPGDRPGAAGADATWDIFTGSWGNSTLDPTGIVVPKLHSSGSANFSGFSSAELDNLLDEAQNTMTGTLRVRHFKRIQEILFKEAPMIFGYAPDEYYAVTGNVKNFVPSTTGMLEMHDIILEETKR